MTIDVELVVREPHPSGFEVARSTLGDVQAEESGEAVVEVVSGGRGALLREEVGASG